MPLTREQRRAQLQQELDGGEIEVTNVDAVDPSPAPAAPAPPAPSPAVALTHDQFSQLLSALGQQQGGQGIGEAVADAIKANRQPMPENPPDQYPAMSIYHPGGKDVPRVPLTTPTFLGLWDVDTGKAVPAYEYPDAMLTDEERVALNGLTPGTREIRCTDGSKLPVRIVAQQDALGAAQRVVIAFPPSAYDKDHRNTLPGPVDLARQWAAA